jgi:proline iminopeptidase
LKRDFYPAIDAYVSYRLAVSDKHNLYVEECGNPRGIPIVFLHGGPGSGCEAWQRRFFNPEKYRIILFDQRGCGRSTPHAELEGNTTWDLVADMERIRNHCGIERWALFGGSWGSTLALAYAEKYPEKVTGLILRGIFLTRERDIQWFYQQGASALYPDYWQDYVSVIPEAERDDMVNAYYRRLTSQDTEVRLTAARAWSIWEGRTATLLPNEKVLDHFGDPQAALSIARIECHYFVHHSFFEPDQLVRDAHRLKNIPGWIVHGRYDTVCPLEGAWALHQAWPEADFRIIPDSGHSAMERGVRSALIEATDALAARLA